MTTLCGNHDPSWCASVAGHYPEPFRSAEMEMEMLQGQRRRTRATRVLENIFEGLICGSDLEAGSAQTG
jgi:hypothetical protein